MFPPRQSLRHRSNQRRGQPAAPIGRGLHQINRRHIGHLCGPIAARQFDFLIAALGNLLAGFNCGGGGGEDHGDLFKMPPHHRGIACMILHALFLLEAGFMGFIDHNQPEIVIGQIKRGAGANSHQSLACGNRAIGAAALRLAQVRMPSDGRMAKAIDEAAQERLSQCNFWQEDKRLPPLPQRFCHSFKIDFSLARSCDAIEQHGREVLRAHHANKLVGSIALDIGQAGGRESGVRRYKGRIQRNFHTLKHARLHQTTDHAL